MSLWFNKDRRTILDEAEDLAYSPSGGRTKQWIAGAAIPLCIIAYGVVCLKTGSTTLPGRRGSIELHGTEGVTLACAYLALGAFLHFHYFWGLQERLQPFSEPLKVLSLLAFLSCFLYTLYHMLLW